MTMFRNFAIYLSFFTVFTWVVKANENINSARISGSKIYYKKTIDLAADIKEPEFETSFSLVSESFSSIPVRRSNNVSPSNEIATIVGQNALLPCAVRNIGSFNILWLRVKDGDVLAYDKLLITQDQRFSLIHNNISESHLFIKGVKESDSGEYACQLNTESLKAKFINLVVLSKEFTN